MPALLEAERLEKQYGPVRALQGVSFVVEPGVTGLLGANGAGKSTALKLFLGLIHPTQGRALFEGVDVASTPLVRQRIGYMPEHDCLPSNVDAVEFLSYMAQISGMPRHDARVRAADTLRHVGLDEERYRPLGSYSTGMKQRVKLAQALVHDPALVLLDEPTAGLDPMGRQQMLELIAHTGREFGISVVLSSHLMGDVERTCDRVIVLDSGLVSREGSVAGFTSETTTLAIVVSEGAEPLAEELRRRGLQPQVEGDVLIVEGIEDADYDVIRDAVVASGALLYSMAPRQHSLTELFRDAMVGSAS
ncbi:MAG: ABC transporter ATP-binding protein [Chloroflexi bacterium]|nr:ABC transporter ATP-binding protein [Chloroflexota bacterium]MDA1148183.1 ABC transporter ATP-binding protein [Chloroflexota bacterium]